MPSLLAYVLLFTAIGAFFIFIHLVIGRFVRPYRPDAEKLTVYECGEPTIGSAWVQFDLRFYVVALLFVIFDVEMAFFFPWAVVFGKANSVASDPLTFEQRVEKLSLLDPEQRAILTNDNLHKADVEHKLKFYNDLVAEMEYEKEHPEETRTKIKKQLAELEEQRARLAGDAPERSALDTQIADLTTRDNRLSNISNRLNQIKQAGPQLSQRDALMSSSKLTASKFAWIAFGDILVFFFVLLVGFAYLWRRGDLDWVRSVAAQDPTPEETRETVGSPG
jgi:NADH:ubiquinone oxidoreductase subunit 3 (subunit A)